MERLGQAQAPGLARAAPDRENLFPERVGQQCYKRLAYLNFEETVSASQLFQADLDPQRIISEISLMLICPSFRLRR